MKRVDWSHFFEVHKDAYVAMKAFYLGGDDVSIELYCMDCER